MPAHLTLTKRFTLMAAAFAFAFWPGTAGAEMPDRLAEIARDSIVYIHYSFVREDGTPETATGTGFVVTSSGYVLTASHVFRKWSELPADVKRSTKIYGSLFDKPGDSISPDYVLTIADLGEAEGRDVALLKLPDDAMVRSAAPICLGKADRSVATGQQIFAFGFPFDQNFQPVSGHLGTLNAPGERWFAESPFTRGMSGGPVYSARGYVMGIVNGGLSGSEAVKYITPIGHAQRLLNQIGLEEKCDASGEPVLGQWRGRYHCHETNFGRGDGTSVLTVTRDAEGRLAGSEHFSRGMLGGSARHLIEKQADNRYVFSVQVMSFPSFSYQLAVRYDSQSQQLVGRYIAHPNCDTIAWRKE